MKRNRKYRCSLGISFIMFSAGIVVVCIFPSEWLVVFTALLLVTAGVILLREGRR